MSKSFGEIARHPARFGVILALGLLALVVGVMNASAVHDEGLFELDGNAVESAAAGDDWDTLANGGGSADDFTGIISDPAAGDVSIFTTGGSKDDLDISQWKYSSGSVPDKDQILHAYAAAYEAANEDLIIYFGLDRFANNGAADLGFWFFRDEVSLGAGGAFSGVHTERTCSGTTITGRGDILVVFEFTQGGVASVVRVLEWVGPAPNCVLAGETVDGNGNLVVIVDSLVTGVNPLCGSTAGDQFCAIGNTACQTVPAVPITDAAGNTISGTWQSTYAAKFPGACSATQFAVSSFFEGGINISAIFGEDVCITNFLAMTRTSPTVRAQLKDFVLGNLDTCPEPDVSVTKTAVENNNDCQFDIVVTAGGTGDSENVVLTDTLPEVCDETLTGPDAGDCSIVGQLLTCNFGTMLNGSTRSISISEACPDIPNTARVTADGDTNPANNSSSDTDIVDCHP